MAEALLALGLVGLATGLWIRMRVIDTPPILDSAPAPLSVVGAAIQMSAQVSMSQLLTVLGVGAVLLGLTFGIATHLTRGELSSLLQEHGLEVRTTPPGRKGSAVRRILRIWWLSLLGGGFLTVVTAALDIFGGRVGEVAARVIASPAIAWSHLAFIMWIPSQVNGLLADPGGLFCFAGGSTRLLSHYQSSVLPFFLTVAVLLAGRPWATAIGGRFRRLADRSGNRIASGPTGRSGQQDSP